MLHNDIHQPGANNQLDEGAYALEDMSGERGQTKCVW